MVFGGWCLGFGVWRLAFGVCRLRLERGEGWLNQKVVFCLPLSVFRKRRVAGVERLAFAVRAGRGMAEPKCGLPFTVLSFP